MGIVTDLMKDEKSHIPPDRVKYEGFKTPDPEKIWDYSLLIYTTKEDDTEEDEIGMVVRKQSLKFMLLVHGLTPQGALQVAFDREISFDMLPATMIDSREVLEVAYEEGLTPESVIHTVHAAQLASLTQVTFEATKTASGCYSDQVLITLAISASNFTKMIFLEEMEGALQFLPDPNNSDLDEAEEAAES